MMTKGNTNFSNETEKFNHAVDLFFGMNPEKRLWILLMFYLAKERALRVVDNYDGAGGFKLMAYMRIDDILDKTVAKKWAEEGIRSRAIIADAPKTLDCHFDELAYAIDVDSHNYAQRVDNTQQGIFSKFRWEAIYLVEISEILTSLSEEWYTENSTWAFDSLIRRLSNQYGKESGIFIQPKELTDLVGRLMDAKSGKLYNPYAGTCSYANVIGEDCSYLGQEFFHTSVALGKLNLLVNGKQNAIVEQCIVDRHWRAHNQQFDYIVSTPPFGLRIPDTSYRTAELQFLAESSRDTKHKSIGVYPASICNHRDPKKKRVFMELIEHDILESIILLPSAIFSTTNITTVIIVVNKRKSNKGFVRFVDASQCKSKSGRNNTLDIHSVMELIECKLPKSGVADISNDVLRLNNYRVTPQFYTSYDDIVCPEGFKIVELSRILTPIEGQKIEENGIHVYKPNINGAKPYGDIVKSSDLPIEQVEKSKYRSVSQDTFIIRQYGVFHPAYLITEDQPVAINRIYDLYSIDKSQVYYQYLLTEMSKDYFIKQIERRWISDARSCIIDEDDFLDLRVLMPNDYEEQIRLSCEAFDIDVQEHINQLSQKYQSKIDNVAKNQSQRKHAVAQVLNEILPSVENIEDFIQDNVVITKDSIVSNRFGTTFHEYIESIHKQLNKVIAMVDNFTNKEEFGEPETIELSKFLEEYCQTTRANEVYRASYVDHYEPEEIEQEVRIARKDLTQILDNLFSNAKKYGFIDPARSDYEIRVSTEPIHDFDQPVVIKIANNGTPVSESISLEKVFTWGIGQGTGIGCWQVKEIAEHFGGDAQYIEYPDDEEGFVCEFRIILPLYAE